MVQPRPDEGHLLGIHQTGQALRLVLGQDGTGVLDGGREVLAEGCPQQRQGGGGEPGLHDRLLVDLGQQDGAVGQLGDRRTGRGDDRRRDQVAAAERREDVDHLGGRAGPGDHQHRVVPAVEPVLAGRERVGLSLAGPLAQPGVGLSHEVRRPAADDRHPRAGPGQVVGELRHPGDDAGPVVRLSGDLPLEVAVRVERHGGSLGWIRSAFGQFGPYPSRREMMARVTVAQPRLLRGRLVAASGVVDDGALVVEGDGIRFAGRASELPVPWQDAPVFDAGPGRHTLLPGLVDVHCHGGAGGEFGADADSAATAVRHHHASGTTTLLGSLVSATADGLVAGVRTCAALASAGDLAGIHLEGPFLSHARRGAQDPATLTDVDPALVEAVLLAAESAGAPGAIAQMTFAPERRGGVRLPALLGSHGVLPALGHTDCDTATAWSSLRSALESAPRGGRPLVTHVFNGMPPLHHRAPGPVAACLAQAARGEAVLEVIGDGVHLAADTVRMLFDLVGPQAICLVTDAMAASGMPDGSYTLGGQNVLVADRTARLADGGSIAGGVATMLDVVRWCVAEAGIPLLDAVTAASVTPAQTLALTGVGTLAAGQHADVVVVDDDLRLTRVMRRGSWLADDALDPEPT